MTTTIPRILPLSERTVKGAAGERFTVMHVVSAEQHHIGWFQLSDDPWRVGLTSARAVVEAGAPSAQVALMHARLLTTLRADHAADLIELPAPIGAVSNPLRLQLDRGRAIERLAHEADELA